MLEWWLLAPVVSGLCIALFVVWGLDLLFGCTALFLQWKAEKELATDAPATKPFPTFCVWFRAGAFRGGLAKLGLCSAGVLSYVISFQLTQDSVPLEAFLPLSPSILYMLMIGGITILHQPQRRVFQDVLRSQYPNSWVCRSSTSQIFRAGAAVFILTSILPLVAYLASLDVSSPAIERLDVEIIVICFLCVWTLLEVFFLFVCTRLLAPAMAEKNRDVMVEMMGEILTVALQDGQFAEAIRGKITHLARGTIVVHLSVLFSCIVVSATDSLILMPLLFPLFHGLGFLFCCERANQPIHALYRWTRKGGVVVIRRDSESE